MYKIERRNVLRMTMFVLIVVFNIVTITRNVDEYEQNVDYQHNLDFLSLNEMQLENDNLETQNYNYLDSNVYYNSKSLGVEGSDDIINTVGGNFYKTELISYFEAKYNLEINQENFYVSETGSVSYFETVEEIISVQKISTKSGDTILVRNIDTTVHQYVWQLDYNSASLLIFEVEYDVGVHVVELNYRMYETFDYYYNMSYFYTEYNFVQHFFGEGQEMTSVDCYIENTKYATCNLHYRGIYSNFPYNKFSTLSYSPSTGWTHESWNNYEGI